MSTLNPYTKFDGLKAELEKNPGVSKLPPIHSFESYPVKEFEPVQESTEDDTEI